MPNQVLFGYHRVTGQPVYLDDEARRLHMFIPGRSGMGKSSLLEFLIRQDIRNGAGVIVIDPHGSLYRQTLSYVARRPSLAERTYLFDINESEHLIGVNYFDLKGISEEKKLDLIMEGWSRVFRETDEVLKTIQRWGPNAIQPLARYPVPLTIVELYRFLVNPNFRDAILARIDDPYILEDWQAFQRLREHEREAVLTALLNRTKRFVRSPHTRALTGQENTIDWEHVFRNRGIVLINLHPEREGSESLAQMLGVIFVHQIMSAANLRSKREARQPVYLYVDEFARIVSSDFRFMLKELRKFGVSLILAQQDLSDLQIDDGQLFETVRNDCGIKACFGMLASESARLLAEDLFLPQVSGLKLKHQHEKPVPWPVSRSDWVTSHGSSDARVDGMNSSSSTLWSEGGVLLTSAGMTDGRMSSSTSGSSSQTSLQRWTEFEERLIKEAPQFWTMEEELTQFAGDIMRQGKGELQFLYDEKKPPVPVRTPKPGVPPFTKVSCRSEDIRAFERFVYSRTGARDRLEVERLIEERQTRLLADAGGEHPLEIIPEPESVPLGFLEDGVRPSTSVLREPKKRRSRPNPARKTQKGPNAP